MRTEQPGLRLRIYVDEGAKHDGRPVHEAVVALCLELGLAGATVLRGVQGYGADLRIRKAGVLRLSSDLPMMIEIADTSEHIEGALPVLEGMIGNGLITVEEVRLIRLTLGD